MCNPESGRDLILLLTRFPWAHGFYTAWFHIFPRLDIEFGDTFCLPISFFFFFAPVFRLYIMCGLGEEKEFFHGMSDMAATKRAIVWWSDRLENVAHECT